MNREEAIKVFEEIKLNYDADPDWGVYDGVFGRSNLTDILDAYAALRGPQPDPITGLVPCGCGGKANEVGRKNTSDWVYECNACGVKTKSQPNNAWAKQDWNMAMGYKEAEE